MIDVVFNLIIFFMLASKLITEEITLAPPPSLTAEKVTAGGSGRWKVINVDHRGRVFLGTQAMRDGRELLAAMRREVERSPQVYDPEGGRMKADLLVKVRADQAADYRHVREVVDVLRQVGVYRMEVGVLHAD
jgi:biopolymer transport protein ExbD